MTPDPVARVKRAASAKRRADAEYRAALRAASEAGVPNVDAAKAAGVSRQAVRQLLRRG